MRRLLAHRLSSSNSAAAKQEWYSIVEGDDPLWEVGGHHAECAMGRGLQELGVQALEGSRAGSGRKMDTRGCLIAVPWSCALWLCRS